MVRALTPLAAVSALWLLPAAAAAAPLDGTYRGHTSQGYKTVAVVKDGVLDSISIPYVAHCRDKRYQWGPVKPNRWVNDPKEPIEHSGNRFSDSGRGRFRQKGGGVVILTGHLSGRFSGKRIAGKQSVSVRIRHKDGYRDYCKSTVRFSAKLTG
jgi:hypothetical protein